MPWCAFEDLVVGPSVLELEGNVVEQFYDRNADTQRLHLRMLHITVDGPDKKAHYRVRLTTQPNGRGGGFHLNLDEQGWAIVRPLLDLIAARQRGEAV